MRYALAGILMVILAGCAVSRQGRAERPARIGYADSPAVALAFTPPIAIGQTELPLWRDERASGAFVSFEDQTTTFIYSLTDDRQANDGTGYYYRRTMIEKTGTSYR